MTYSSCLLPAHFPSRSSYYSASSDRGGKYCDERVCLSVVVRVCFSVRDHIFGTALSGLYQIFVHVAYGRGSVFLWQCIDTLCTSGFMDDVIFSHKQRLLDISA